jgi:hypothetical protein
MPLSQEQKTKLRLSTAEAARALVEDLNYIREVSKRVESSRGELRRLSAVIRRILVDNDLGKIAAPRLGKLTIDAPDNEAYYDVEKWAQILFFASGGAPVFGTGFSLAFLNAGPPPHEPAKMQAIELMQDVKNRQRRVALRINNFMTQRVLCYMGDWFSRRDAIKYIANVQSGVHSTQNAPTKDLKDLSPLLAACSYRAVGGRLEVHVLKELGEDSAKMFVDPIEGPLPETYPTEALDPVLLEVLAAGIMVANSPDVIELEKIIRAELN